jgi:hypothetical protein
MTEHPDLDAIQARAQAATPGPWGVYDGGDHANIGANLATLSRSTWRSDCEIAEIDAETYVDSNLCPHDEGEDAEAWAAQQALDDAQFIAQARTDVPALLARVQELEAENARLASQARDLRITCAVCAGPVGYIDCPTGGWWAHDRHPVDGHDAEPVQRAPEA